MLTASLLHPSGLLLDRVSKQRISRHLLVDGDYVGSIAIPLQTPSGSMLVSGNHQSRCPPLRSSQPGGDRHLQAVISSAFMEEDTGAVGAHRREATPELMHERFPGKGGLSKQRRHLCTCLERETPSGAGQVIQCGWH